MKTRVVQHTVATGKQQRSSITADALERQAIADDLQNMIFPPFFGQRFKVILTERNTMIMLRWCQPEGDTQVVLGLSAVLAA